jgi:peptidoglycan/xylan/chitin deacetylase (PgdA/CDA1 family)
MGDAFVLCYHAVSPDWPADLSIPPDALERHLAMLSRRGYRGVTFGELVRGHADGRLVAVTFDDAYRSVYELARPILADAGFPGSVFVPTDFPDREAPMAWPGVDRWIGGPHERELLPMSWDQLGELAESGWEVGSHSRSHPRLTTLDDARLRSELADSRELCEQRLDRRCLTLTYPYGDWDARVASAARECGYRAAGTLSRSLAERQALTWPRVGIYHHDAGWRFRLKAAPLVRRLRAAR